MAALLSLLLACASLGSAGPVGPRTVSSLNDAAFAEAQQRDNGATRAFSNVQIKVRFQRQRKVATSKLNPSQDIRWEMSLR
jgi:hypothetical protein